MLSQLHTYTTSTCIRCHSVNERGGGTERESMGFERVQATNKLPKIPIFIPSAGSVATIWLHHVLSD